MGISFWILIILVLVGLYLFLQPRLLILNSYVAKKVCSYYFIAGRDLRQTSDLHFLPANLAKYRIDPEARTVTSSVLGLGKRKAIHREGLGSTLVIDFPENQLRLAARPQLFSSPNPLPLDLPWPLGQASIQTQSLPSEIDYDQLHKAMEAAFDAPFAKPYHKTHAVLVVYKNQLVAEQYAPGISPQTPLIGWSMTKSVLNALIGILVKAGRMDIHQPVPIPEWQKDARKEITWHHLLQMSSGLYWREKYTTISDVTKMLFMRDDMYNFVIDRPLESPPDTHWLYASGTSNILSGLLRQLIGDDETYHRFPYEALFHKIGMHRIRLETDAAGTYVASSFSFSPPRDWARFALLYLQDGIWQGERVLPEGWVDYTRQPAKASGGGYGAHFWLNQAGEFPDAPRDIYHISGFQGQKGFIIPSRDMFILRMGASKEGQFDFNTLIVEILKAFPHP